MRRYLFILLIVCLPALVFCAGKPPVVKSITHKAPAILRTDSTDIRQRSFDSTALNHYKTLPEFKYDDGVKTPSLWTRFWRWFWNWITSIFRSAKPHGPSEGFWRIFLTCLKYFFIALGLAAIVFIVLKIAGMDTSFLFKRKAASAGLPYDESLENIHEISFDEEIERAVASHNYRLAVRLLYLKSLKQLSDASLIDWQPEKTNSAYINELSNTNQISTFKLLTRQFEYIWYGEFQIDSALFGQINNMFQKFKSEIK